MSAQPDNKLALLNVPLKDLHENEFVAIEVIGEHDYDRVLHPQLVTNNRPIFAQNKTTKEWRLLAAPNDTLFEEFGYHRHQSALNSYLSQYLEDSHHELNIEDYNANADVKLVPGIDYIEDTPCTLPKYSFDGKMYFIIDALSYNLRVTSASPDQVMKVVVFNGQRLHEIAEEQDREAERIFSEKPRHLSVHCEVGRFICAILAKDTLTFQYNVETNTFGLSEADSSRLYLMYVRDTSFISKMSSVLMEYLVSLDHISLLHMRTSNTTIEISATLLEMRYAKTHGITERQDCCVLLHKYNLDRLASMGLVHERDYNQDTEAHMHLVYIDIEEKDYLARKQLFIDTFGQEPRADFYVFADTELKTIAIND